MLIGGAQWAVRQGYGSEADLEFIEEHGWVAGAVAENVSALAKKRQRGEMGTLGSGNHYLEVQVVDRIYDEAAAQAYGLRAGTDPGFDPLRLARPGPSDRHRLSGEPGEGRHAPGHPSSPTASSPARRSTRPRASSTSAR